MNVHFVSLGCPKNRVDTEVMLGHTAERRPPAGRRRPRPPRSSSSTPAASSARPSRSRSTPSWRWRATRRRAPASAWSWRAACRSATRKSWPTEMPEVDHFLGTDEVGVDRQGDRRDAPRACSVAETPALPLRRRRAAPPLAWRRTRAYVKIAEGCDRPVRVLHHPQAARPAAQPHARVGRARGRSELAAGGTKEICLVAQDLTTYGTRPARTARRSRAPTLASLLRELARRRGAALDPPALRLPDRRAPTSCST